MADSAVVVTCSNNKKETRPGLETAHPPAVSYRRQISYGSSLPFFVINSEYLITFLREQGGSYELPESASLKSSHSFPKALTQTDTPDSDLGAIVVDSPVTSINTTVRRTFLTECDFQVRKLFNFMEVHLLNAENELDNVSKRQKVPTRDNIGATTVRENGSNSNSLSSSDTSSESSPLLGSGKRSPLVDSGGESSLLDSGVIEDNYDQRDKIHLLCHVKEILLSLQESLSASFESIDQLIAIHDDEGVTTDGALYRQSREDEKQDFERRLKTNLDRINSKLGTVEKVKELKLDNLGRLRSETIATANVRKTPVGCFVYLSFLLYLFVWTIISFMYFWDKQDTWTVFLRLTRGPLLVVFFLYYFGTNMKGWANSGVDYIAIFKYNSAATPTPKYVFKIAKIFTLLFGAGVVGLLIVNPFHAIVPMKIFPLLMWLSLFLFWINPFKVFNRQSRFRSILSCVRILIAPLIVVHFTDFWFADQLNSIVAILLDFQYMVCYTAYGTWTGQVDVAVCTTSDNGIRPVISCLPALWRMMQCFRYYYDTRKVSHLVNAGKYFTTFPVIVFAALFAAKVPRGFNILHLDVDDLLGLVIIFWFVSSFIHALYTFLWDVKRDWGLFDLRNKTLLRPRLLYRRRCVYYLAIIVDFFLRFAWAAKLSLAIVWHLDSDFIYTVLVFGELIRRYIWNYFRLEYEHVMQDLD